MRHLLLALATATSALFAAGHAAAATYYVSPSGSDGNSGASPAAPWRTIHAVNGPSLSAGDTVSFQGGQTFSDTTLIPSPSASARPPITFPSYASTHPPTS